MYGKPVECRRCPRNGKQAVRIVNAPLWPIQPWEGGDPILRARRPVRSSPSAAAGMHAARLKENPSMKSLPIAGLVSLATLGAQAQTPASPLLKQGFESVVVTATRSLQPTPSLRDTIV